MSDQDPSRVIAARARAVASTTDPAAVYSAVAEAAVTTFGATAARVWIDEPSTGSLVAVGSFGVGPEVEQVLMDAVRLPYGVGLPGSIFASRQPEFISDARSDPRWVNSRYIQALGIQGYAGIPLVVAEQMMGVLSILFDRYRVFTESEETLGGILADYAAITVRVAQLYDERRRADALEAVNLLARSTAHEINSPLTVVFGNLDLAARELGDDARAAVRIVRIRDAAERVAEMVSRMQHIVRLESAWGTGSPEIPPMLDLRRSSTL